MAKSDKKTSEKKGKRRASHDCAVRRKVDRAVYVSERVAYLVVLWALTFAVATDAIVRQEINPYLLVATGLGHGVRAALTGVRRSRES